MATVADLIALLKTSAAPNLTGSGQVWRLDGNDRMAEDLRRYFLDIAARFPSVFVHYDGGQPDAPSLREAKQIAPDVWRLPVAATGQDLAAWLHMGNWQLYGRSAPLNELRDLCRTGDLGVLSFAREAGVTFIVDSFHDDAHWTICLVLEATWQQTPVSKGDRTRRGASTSRQGPRDEPPQVAILAVSKVQKKNLRSQL